MAKKPFEIQDSRLRLGGVDLQAGTTGVVIPGVTQATTYRVEEVEETDVDQTLVFVGQPLTIIDAVTYNDYVANGTSTGRATYTLEYEDGGASIDEIKVATSGSYTPAEATTNANTDIWVTDYPGDPFAAFDTNVWAQVPFRPKMRAGDVETIGGGGGSLGNFEAEGSELYAPNEETIQINTFNADGVKKAHITLNPDYEIAKFSVNTQRGWNFSENNDYQMGNTWSDDGSGGGVIALTGVSQYLYDIINQSGRYVEKKIILNSNTYNFTGWNGGGTVGVDAYFNLYTDVGPGGDPVAVSYFEITGVFENRLLFDNDEGDYGIWIDNDSFRIDAGSDINLYAGDDLRLEGNDVVHLRNKGLGESVRITSQYGQGNERDWYFDHTGVLSGPGSEGSLLVYGLESKDNHLYVGINNAQPSWPAISDILTSAVSRVNFVGSISALPDVGSISFTGIQTWTQMNNVRYYYQKFDDTSISLYVDVNRTTPLNTTVFGTDYIQDTVNTYTWQQYSNNAGASFGSVDSVAYPGIVNVPQGADVVSNNLTPGGESIALIGLSQFEGIYHITFSLDTGTGRHYLGVDYTASWTTSGVATGSAVYTTDGYDVRLVPTTGSGTGATAGRVKVESELLELSSGATLGGIGIITPADDNFGIRTQFYPTVSAEAGQGTTEASAFFDTTFVDDISVVQVGWQYNAGTQQSPIWIAATQAEFVGENLFVITVPGVTFEVGNTYTFRNPSIETDTWYFNSDRTFTTPAGGKISHINNDLKIETVGLTDVIVLRTAGGDLVINSDASLTFNSGATISTTAPVGAGGQGLVLSPDPEFGQGQGLRIYPTNAEVEHLHVTANDPANVDLFLGDDNQYVKVSRTGEIQIASYDGTATTYLWTFDDIGNLTLPSGSSILDLEITGGPTPSSLMILGAGATVAENQRAARVALNGDVEGVSIGAGTNNWLFTNDGSVTFPDSTVQTTAWTGSVTRSIETVSVTAPTAVTAGVVFGDPNAAGGNVNIVLPSSAVGGTVITVKNINAGGNSVFVQTDGIQNMETESGSIGSGVYATIGTTGGYITWIYDDVATTWRIIG